MSMQRSWFIALLLALALFVSSNTPVLAQEGDIPQQAANLTVFTRFPVQEVAIGETVSLNLTLRADTSPYFARLEVEDLPEGWDATFRGGGDVIKAVYVDPEEETSVTLRVEPPADVAPDSYRFTVVARSDSGVEAELPIELVVKEKLPPSLDFEIELPTLRGTRDSTFRYDVELKNEGDEELSVNLVAETSQPFLVTFKLTGKEVTSIPVAANETKRLNVEARPFAELPAGDYPINLIAQSSQAQASATVTAEITGQPELRVTAPDGRLSGQAYAGDSTPLTLLVQNTGTAPARDIDLSASPPAGWTVEFEPKNIPEISAGSQLEVTANIQPAEQAVAGDYMVTLRAQPDEGASESAEFRITVLTSTLWGIVGVGFIAVAVIVVALAVLRFGRR